MLFRKLQRSVRLESVDHLRIHHMVDGRKLHRRVQQTVTDGIKRFRDHTLVRHPELFIQGALDLFGTRGKALTVAPDLFCDFRKNQIRAIVIRRRLCAARTVVVMTVGDPCVELILIQPVVIGIKNSRFEIRHCAHVVKILFGKRKIARPFDVIKHHIEGTLVHVIRSVIGLQNRVFLDGKECRESADGVFKLVVSSVMEVAAFAVVIPNALVLHVAARNVAEPHRHGRFYPIPPAECGGRIPVSPPEEGGVVRKRAVIKGILMPRGIHCHHSGSDGEIKRFFRGRNVNAGVLCVQLLLDVAHGVFHREILLKGCFVRVIKHEDIAVKHLPRLDGCRNFHDVVVVMLGGISKEDARIRLGHRFRRAKREVRIKARGDSYVSTVLLLCDASTVFPKLHHVAFGILHTKITVRNSLILKTAAARTLRNAAKARNEVNVLVGGNSVMHKIPVIGKKRICFNIHADIGKPSRALGKLVLHPAVLKFGNDVLGIVKPTGGGVDISGIPERRARSGGDRKATVQLTALVVVGHIVLDPVGRRTEELRNIPREGKEAIRLVVVLM